eukprot:1832813-Amphidinium_carterae.1
MAAAHALASLAKKPAQCHALPACRPRRCQKRSTHHPDRCSSNSYMAQMPLTTATYQGPRLCTLLLPTSSTE